MKKYLFTLLLFATFAIDKATADSNLVVNGVLVELIEDPAELSDGDVVAIVNSGTTSGTSTSAAIGSYKSSNNNYGRASSSYKDPYRLIEEATMITMVKTEDGYWMLQVSDNTYLSSPTSNSFNLFPTEEVDDHCKATISLDDDSKPVIAFKEASTKRYYLLYHGSTTLRWGCGTESNLSGSSYYRPYIFRQVGIDVTISSVGWATYHNTDNSLVVPTGIEARTYKVADGELTVSKTYAVGDTIPAGEAVVLKGSEGTYRFLVTVNPPDKDANNQLVGYSEETTPTDEDKVYYMLSLDANSTEGSVGFYWGAENGGPFVCQPNKAYLVVDKSDSSSAKLSFSLSGEQSGAPTGIEAVPTATAAGESACYNLAGQRVEAEYKGIVVKNGRKFIAK